MRFLSMIRLDENSGKVPSEKLMADMGKLIEEMTREGALIIELIQELKQRADVSMIVIAHNYVHVLELCDRVNLLRNGRILLDKRTDETSVEELTAIVAAEYRLPKSA